MNTPERKATLRRALLLACRDSLVRETVLQTQLAEEVSPAPMLAEVQQEIAELERGGFVSGLRPALGGPAKWMATDLGRAALQG